MRVLRMLALNAAVAALFLILLVGCEPRDPIEEVRSVEWYETYDSERSKKLAECKADPAKLDGTPDCVNASLAENNKQDATIWHEGSDEDDIRVEPPITQ